jgi:hypothetical protein
MAYEQKNMSGAIFDNDRKQNDRQPDMTGNCIIDGKPYRISAWRKPGSRGEFLSLAFSEPQPQQGRSDSPQSRPASQPPTRTGTRPAPATQQFQDGGAAAGDDSPF